MAVAAPYGTPWPMIPNMTAFTSVPAMVRRGTRKSAAPARGDNLFVCSIIALDADTGEYVWHYQINPGETWDYNAAMDIALADLPVNGKTRPVLMTAPKNGFYYVIDRENGKLLSAEKFVDGVTWATKIDLKTGRPVETADARYPGGKPVLVSPNPTGAHAAEAMAFSPKSGLAFIPAIEQSKIYVDAPDLKGWTFPKGQMIANGTGAPPPDMKVPPFRNYLLGWNPVTQKPAWKVPLIGAKAGGVMATGGNLVFQGNITGELAAYAADTGKKLWAFNAQNGILAQPISYQAGGKQYVTVMTGWRQSGMSGTGFEWAYRQQKRRVLTFVLGGKGTLPPADRTMPAIQDDPKFAIDEARAAAGEKTYGARCGVCHGGALKSGGAAPDLRASPIALDYESIRAVLQDGALVARGMPRYGEFSRDQVAEIQHYVRREARKAKAEGR
jgi:quinohemoprotein ethanol dehydrogenase